MRNIDSENRAKFVRMLQEAKQHNGETLRSLSAQTGLDHTTIHRILTGGRLPSRDALIVLCGWGLMFTIEETDYILGLVAYAPLSSRPKAANTANLQIVLGQQLSTK